MTEERREYQKRMERKFEETVWNLAHEIPEDLPKNEAIVKTLQSIDRTLKRIEIILWKDIENRSFFLDVPKLYQQMSEEGLTGSCAE